MTSVCNVPIWVRALETQTQESAQRLEGAEARWQVGSCRLCSPSLFLGLSRKFFFWATLVCCKHSWWEQPRLGWPVLLVPIRQVKFHKSLSLFFFQLGVFCHFNIFNFINICRKDAGISYFLLERHVHLPSFPFNLPVSLTYLLLNSAAISPCCDGSPAPHGT